jgi:large subunit ribosomal protein L10
MLIKAKKEKIVEELAEKLQRQKVAIFTDFHGISVNKLQKLRRELKKNGGEYKVARKTLLDRAFAKSGIVIKAKDLKGELGVAFSFGDETASVKTIVKFKKENEPFKILGGILGIKVLSEKDIIIFSKRPPREVLLAQVVGVLQWPLRGLVAVLNGNIRNLVVVLNQIKEKKAV